ncbi:LacI family DNA-binding transcriptional regulator [Polymorphobacter fuscus]|uniref:LacI family DNA-binding transcriptional regulator n=1 Tax=Sandarakinorhabdus fusca TaxID=1439888 RepID=A0A7C9GX70_9SPHN|nr:LacI family transcriptional regulator [Polymorphobacter fuscus]MQT18718.1 LacI family DNA-binding transcriptional regulator [Polymorphobacter fuscus]
MSGNAKPTINDIARLSGVSKKTVSRVINRSPLLNEETRKRVDDVIRQTGYIPNPQARALALRRNFLIGLVHDNPNAQMVLGVQQGILSVLKGTEYELIVRPVDRGSTTLVADVRSFLERQRLHGVVLLPPISENDGLASLCLELGCRYVRMGSAELDDAAHMVASNDREVVREVVTFLMTTGHRRIGIITGPPGFRSASERHHGFNEALVAGGITPEPAWAVEGNYRFESGLVATRNLLAQDPRPTAIFASNDEMAAGALHAAREMGLDVPADLSIIGFDDTAIAAHIWPPLTTVRWPIVEMGKAAARKLLAGTIDALPEMPGDALFLSALIQRASVAPPR